MCAAIFCAAIAAAQEGGKAWEFKLDGQISSSPALSPDEKTVYVGVENRFGGGYVVAIDLADLRRPKWTFTRARPIVMSTPALSSDGGTLYVGCEDGRFYALNTANGSVRRELNLGVDVDSSPAIAADGTVYFGANDFKLHAVTADLAELWSYRTGGFVDSSPAIGADGTVYFGSWDKSVYALTPGATPTLKWQFPTGGRISASPAIGADGTIYVGSYDHRLYAFAPDGTKKWDFVTGDAIWSSPAIGADGTIYFASSDTYLYALDPNAPEKDRQKWRVPLNAATTSTAAIRGDGTIVLGLDGGRLAGFNPADGGKKFEFVAEGIGLVADASPLIGPDGAIYIGFLGSSFLYKVNGNGSPLSQYSAWPGFRRDTARTGRARASANGGQLLNLSTRAIADGGVDLIAGFFIQGTGARPYLMRGIGPSLARFGVGAFLADPRLRLFSGPRQIASNDNWEEPVVFATVQTPDAASSAAATGAFPLTPGTKDAAMVPVLTPGLYTAQVESVGGSTGVALVEMYELPESFAGPRAARLLNLSTRGQVRGGENDLIAGVVVGGTGPTRLLVRGVGPGLADFGVDGVLPRPSVSVMSGVQVLRSNAGWTTDGFKFDLSSAARDVGAFALAEGSLDSATIVTVQPGNYTMQVSGVNGATGVALVEIYVLP